MEVRTAECGRQRLSHLTSQEKTQAAQPENAHHISPAAAELLESHCSTYHGEDSQKGDVRFERLGELPLPEQLALQNRVDPAW